jgi:hypothetical protein
MQFRAVAAATLLAGFTLLHSARAQDAYPLPGRYVGQSTPLVADIDSDPSNGLETVIATPDSRVQALRSDGSVLWTRELPNFSCTSAPANDKLYSSPVLAQLYGDARKFIVIGYGGFRGKPCDGGVAALRAGDGSIEWTFSIKKWARKRGFDAFRNSVYGTPAVGDVDGDGKQEVGFGAFDRNVYLLNSNGTVRWYYNAADTVFTSPAFSDIDGDGRLEMLIGTDISQNLRIKPATPNGGYFYALKAGAPVPRPGYRYLFRDPKLQAWRTEFDQVMQSTPAIGDVLPDAPGLEVVVGSGCFFPQGGGDRRGKWYKVLSVKTGAVLKTLPVTACTPSGAAIGDVNGDGVLDVVVSVSGDASAGGDGQSHLVAWTPSQDRVLWDISPRVAGRSDRFGGHYNRAPVIADLGADGAKEVLVNYANGVAIADGSSGQLLSCAESPCLGQLFRSDDVLQGRPAVADTNGDGLPEIIVGGKKSGLGALLRWSGPFNLHYQ